MDTRNLEELEQAAWALSKEIDAALNASAKAGYQAVPYYLKQARQAMLDSYENLHKASAQDYADRAALSEMAAHARVLEMTGI